MLLHGSPRLGHQVAGLRLTSHARSFFQANRFLVDDLVAHVLDQTARGGPGPRPLRGGGSLRPAPARTAARRCARSRATRSRWRTRGRTRAASGSPAAGSRPRTCGEALAASAAGGRRGRRPRSSARGAGLDVVEILAARRPRAIVYVSCDPPPWAATSRTSPASAIARTPCGPSTCSRTPSTWRRSRASCPGLSPVTLAEVSRPRRGAARSGRRVAAPMPRPLLVLARWPSASAVSWAATSGAAAAVAPSRSGGGRCSASPCRAAPLRPRAPSLAGALALGAAGAAIESARLRRARPRPAGSGERSGGEGPRAPARHRRRARARRRRASTPWSWTSRPLGRARAARPGPRPGAGGDRRRSGAASTSRRATGSSSGQPRAPAASAEPGSLRPRGLGAAGGLARASATARARCSCGARRRAAGPRSLAAWPRRAREWARARLRRHVLAGPPAGPGARHGPGRPQRPRRGHRARPFGARAPTTSWPCRAPRWRSWPGCSWRLGRRAESRPCPWPSWSRWRPRRLRAARGRRRPGVARRGHGHRHPAGPGPRPGRRPGEPAGPGGAAAARLRAPRRRGRRLPALLRRHPGHRAPRSPACCARLPRLPLGAGPLVAGSVAAQAALLPAPGPPLPPPRPGRAPAEPGRRAPLGRGPAPGGARAAPGRGRGLAGRPSRAIWPGWPPTRSCGRATAEAWRRRSTWRTPDPTLLVLAAVGPLPARARTAGAGRRRPLALGPRRSLACAIGPGPRADGRLELAVLDVGQGDALVLRSPSGRAMARGRRAGPRGLRPWASASWRPSCGRRACAELDRLVLTHAHPDHAGGVPFLLRAFRRARGLGGHRPAAGRRV